MDALKVKIGRKTATKDSENPIKKQQKTAFLSVQNPTHDIIPAGLRGAVMGRFIMDHCGRNGRPLWEKADKISMTSSR